MQHNVGSSDPEEFHQHPITSLLTRIRETTTSQQKSNFIGSYNCRRILPVSTTRQYFLLYRGIQIEQNVGRDDGPHVLHPASVTDIQQLYQSPGVLQTSSLLQEEDLTQVLRVCW